MKNSYKEIWDELYRKRKIFPHVQDYIDKLIELFKKFNVQKVLDLACGSGRNLIFLLENGFNVYGIDISEEAIKIAKSSLEKKNLNAELFIGSMFEKLPYLDDYFDAIICIRSFNHGRIEEIRNGIIELQRILKSGGLLFLTVRKKVSKKKRLPFKQIAPRTYVPLEGDEIGIEHYFFNKRILRKEFNDFKICNLKVKKGPKAWEAYYHLFGKLKKP